MSMEICFFGRSARFSKLEMQVKKSVLDFNIQAVGLVWPRANNEWKPVLRKKTLEWCSHGRRKEGRPEIDGS